MSLPTVKDGFAQYVKHYANYKQYVETTYSGDKNKTVISNSIASKLHNIINKSYILNFNAF